MDGAGGLFTREEGLAGWLLVLCLTYYSGLQQLSSTAKTWMGWRDGYSWCNTIFFGVSQGNVIRHFYYSSSVLLFFLFPTYLLELVYFRYLGRAVAHRRNERGWRQQWADIF